MCLSVVRGISRPSTIVFENNQFKNVVIAIHDSVPEDKSLIDTLKVNLYLACNGTAALLMRTRTYVLFVKKCGKWQYSRLSLSRSPRDSLKYFEISVL